MPQRAKANMMNRLLPTLMLPCCDKDKSFSIKAKKMEIISQIYIHPTAVKTFRNGTIAQFLILTSALMLSLRPLDRRPSGRPQHALIRGPRRPGNASSTSVNNNPDFLKGSKQLAAVWLEAPEGTGRLTAHPATK